MTSRGSVPLRFLGKIFCSALILLGVIMSASPVSAANNSHILVSPTTLSVALDPGQVYQGSFSVKNTGDVAETLYPIARPYSVSGENYIPNYDEEQSAYSQIYKWVTFSRSEFYLEPGGEAKVEFVVTTPQDVPAGSQYAALLMEARGDGRSMFNTNTRVGPLLLAQVNGETRLEGKYRNQHMSQFVALGPFVAQTYFENPGNVDYKVSSTLVARNFFTGNNDYDNTEAPVELLVFPDRPRLIDITWPDQPLFGIYNVTYTVNFLDEDHTIERVVIFFPIWAILLFVALIIFLIILGILDHQKRHRFARVVDKNLNL